MSLPVDILGSPTIPDTSGNVYAEPAAVNFQANDRYPGLVFVFADSGTRIALGIGFRVPDDYIGVSASIELIWGTTATTGDARLEFDYTAIADNESLDPSADQESVGATATVPGTARLRETTTLTLTPGNFAAGDWVEGQIVRDGADAADTLAASLYLIGATFIGT